MAGDVKINKIQLGESLTATNNFVLAVPDVPILPLSAAVVEWDGQYKTRTIL